MEINFKNVGCKFDLIVKIIFSTSNMIRTNIKYNVLKLLTHMLLLSLVGCGEVKHNSEP